MRISRHVSHLRTSSGSAPGLARASFWLALLVVIAPLGACKPATQVTLELTTDVLCVDLEETSISVGDFATLESRPPSTTTRKCSDGRIGSLAVVPSRGNRSAFAVKVVAGVAKSADECERSGYQGGCIVARRALNFVPEQNLELPIELEIACLDIPCGATETCRNGRCVSATLADPRACSDPLGCDGGTGVDDAGRQRDAASMDATDTDAGGTNPDVADASSTDAGTSDTGSVDASDPDASGMDAAGVDGSSMDASGADASGADASGADAGGADADANGPDAGDPDAADASSTEAGDGDAAGADASDAEAGPPGPTVDSTEVTRAQYAAWLQTAPSLAAQPAYCSTNTDFTPKCNWPPGSFGDHPVVCVDWCDAFAYCQGVGRRLCGSPAGGRTPFSLFNTTANSQWYAACVSGGSAGPWPYGSTFDGAACNTSSAGFGNSRPVGSLTTCQSSVAGYQGVFDLSGNVSEWEDACAGYQGFTDEGCRLRGGSYADARASVRCDTDAFASRSFTDSATGFRCCAL